MIKHLTLALLLTASAAHAEIYTWRAGGTDFYTNSLEEIPARHLKKARVLDVATGKKGALATARPVAPPGTAGAPGSGSLPGSATAPGSAPFPTQGGTQVAPGAAPGPGTSNAATTPPTAPEPVAVTTPPSSTVPTQLTAPRQRSKEGRFQRRSHRRADDAEDE